MCVRVSASAQSAGSATLHRDRQRAASAGAIGCRRPARADRRRASLRPVFRPNATDRRGAAGILRAARSPARHAPTTHIAAGPRAAVGLLVSCIRQAVCVRPRRISLGGRSAASYSVRSGGGSCRIAMGASPSPPNSSRGRCYFCGASPAVRFRELGAALALITAALHQSAPGYTRSSFPFHLHAKVLSRRKFQPSAANDGMGKRSWLMRIWRSDVWLEIPSECERKKESGGRPA